MSEHDASPPIMGEEVTDPVTRRSMEQHLRDAGFVAGDLRFWKAVHGLGIVGRRAAYNALRDLALETGDSDRANTVREYIMALEAHLVRARKVRSS